MKLYVAGLSCLASGIILFKSSNYASQLDQTANIISGQNKKDPKNKNLLYFPHQAKASVNITNFLNNKKSILLVCGAQQIGKSTAIRMVFESKQLNPIKLRLHPHRNQQEIFNDMLSQTTKIWYEKYLNDKKNSGISFGEKIMMSISNYFRKIGKNLDTVSLWKTHKKIKDLHTVKDCIDILPKSTIIWINTIVAMEFAYQEQFDLIELLNDETRELKTIVEINGGASFDFLCNKEINKECITIREEITKDWVEKYFVDYVIKTFEYDKLKSDQSVRDIILNQGNHMQKIIGSHVGDWNMILRHTRYPTTIGDLESGFILGKKDVIEKARYDINDIYYLYSGNEKNPVSFPKPIVKQKYFEFQSCDPLPDTVGTHYGILKYKPRYEFMKKINDTIKNFNIPCQSWTKLNYSNELSFALYSDAFVIVSDETNETKMINNLVFIPSRSSIKYYMMNNN